MKPTTPEQAPLGSATPERGQIVLQPNKATDLAMLVAEINKLPSETTSEDRSGDASAGTVATSTGGTTQTASARQQAIAHLPAPTTMQKQLEKHIRTEVKQLRKSARRIVRSRKPGSAYALAQLYAKIRHLNHLLAALAEASYDVLKRLFIKVFIDRQTIG